MKIHLLSLLATDEFPPVTLELWVVIWTGCGPTLARTLVGSAGLRRITGTTQTHWTTTSEWSLWVEWEELWSDICILSLFIPNDSSKRPSLLTTPSSKWFPWPPQTLPPTPPALFPGGATCSTKESRLLNCKWPTFCSTIGTFARPLISPYLPTPSVRVYMGVALILAR